MEKITAKRHGTPIGSRAMPNPQIKMSVEEGLYARAEEEAARLGIKVTDLARHALIAALELPRRLEDVVALQERLTAINKRLDALERAAGSRKR